jgi:hypothetical protein
MLCSMERLCSKLYKMFKVLIYTRVMVVSLSTIHFPAGLYCRMLSKPGPLVTRGQHAETSLVEGSLDETTRAS